MPGQDRTGPMGQGSQTGRALGKCKSPESKDLAEKENDQMVFGPGFRRRAGFGHDQDGERPFGRGRGVGRRGGRGRGLGRR